VVTPSVEELRQEATRFLDSHASRRSERRFAWGEGSDRVGLFEEKTADEEAAEVAAAKEWKATEFDAGFGWITGPARYGGRELPPDHERAYAALARGYEIPSQSCFGIGLGMVAPHDPGPRDRRGTGALPPAAAPRRDIGCQLFSEPDRGLRPGRDPDPRRRRRRRVVVTGQKVWTSGAQYSDVGEVIHPHLAHKPKHRGLTMFVVDMHAPGCGGPAAAP